MLRHDTESISIENLFFGMCNNQAERPIVLNAVYQRDVVWDFDQKQAYIDSILLGFNATTIIFNKESKQKICIDGKQRLTSIKEYYENIFPHNEYDDNENIIKQTYYSAKPNSEKNNPKCCVMTDEQRKNFCDAKIHVTTYDNLPFESQIELFNRIQRGKPLTINEKTVSTIIDEKSCEIFKNFCIINKECFSTNDKNNYIKIISDLSFMIAGKNFKCPDKKTREKYISKLKINDVNKIITIMTHVLDNICGGIFKEDKIVTKRITLNVYYVLVYLINKNFPIDKFTTNYDKIVNIVVNVWNEWNINTNQLRTSTTSIAYNTINDLFIKHNEK